MLCVLYYFVEFRSGSKACILIMSQQSLASNIFNSIHAYVHWCKGATGVATHLLTHGATHSKSFTLLALI